MGHHSRESRKSSYQPSDASFSTSSSSTYETSRSKGREHSFSRGLVNWAVGGRLGDTSMKVKQSKADGSRQHGKNYNGLYLVSKPQEQGDFSSESSNYSRRRSNSDRDSFSGGRSVLVDDGDGMAYSNQFGGRSGQGTRPPPPRSMGDGAFPPSRNPQPPPPQPPTRHRQGQDRESFPEKYAYGQRPGHQ
jgi:hypothetical protein